MSCPNTWRLSVGLENPLCSVRASGSMNSNQPVDEPPPAQDEPPKPRDEQCSKSVAADVSPRTSARQDDQRRLTSAATGVGTAQLANPAARSRGRQSAHFPPGQEISAD